ncbi:MAG: HAD family hydrolase [Pseudomonadota bacterium]
MTAPVNIAIPSKIAGGPPRPVKAVVFDFDGTLAGLEIDFDLMRREISRLCLEFGVGNGLSSQYVLEMIAAAESLLSARDPGKAQLFAARAKGIIEDIELEAARRGRLFPETRPALAALKNAGLGLAIITRNFGRAVRIVFPDLDDFVPVFLPREAVPKVKPDPGHLLTALKALAASPDSSLMVGDHPLDIETGQRAGTMTAGVASGRIGRDELSGAGADAAFDRLADLADFLLGRPSRPR